MWCPCRRPVFSPVRRHYSRACLQQQTRLLKLIHLPQPRRPRPRRLRLRPRRPHHHRHHPPRPRCHHHPRQPRAAARQSRGPRQPPRRPRRPRPPRRRPRPPSRRTACSPGSTRSGGSPPAVPPPTHAQRPRPSVATGRCAAARAHRIRGRLVPRLELSLARDLRDAAIAARPPCGVRTHLVVVLLRGLHDARDVGLADLHTASVRRPPHRSRGAAPRTCIRASVARSWPMSQCL